MAYKMWKTVSEFDGHVFTINFLEGEQLALKLEFFEGETATNENELRLEPVSSPFVKIDGREMPLHVFVKEMKIEMHRAAMGRRKATTRERYVRNIEISLPII